MSDSGGITISASGYSTPNVAHVAISEFLQSTISTLRHSSTRTGRIDVDANLVDLVHNAEIERHIRDISEIETLLAVNGDTRLFLLKQYGTLYVTVAGADFDAVDTESKLIVDSAPQAEVPDNSVNIDVWHLAPTGPSHHLKQITTPRWVEIERNYPGRVGESLSALMKSQEPTDETTGRIVLWYGPPGTGKTTALRALAREWKPWCDVQIISDPELLFSNPGYLTTVAGSGCRWKLVVAEDSDAFLHVGGGGSAAMGRLLNFSDGILGQGTNTLFLLTTNEPVTKLHPAVTRPGRCLAQIEFEKFGQREAAQWLGDSYAAPPTEQTLAELMEWRRDDHKKVVHEKVYEPIGQYL